MEIGTGWIRCVADGEVIQAEFVVSRTKFRSFPIRPAVPMLILISILILGLNRIGLHFTCLIWRKLFQTLETPKAIFPTIGNQPPARHQPI